MKRNIRLDYQSAKKYVRMECQSNGLGVVFHPKGEIQGPYTDGTNLHVFEPNAMWNEDQWNDWEYEVYHEIGHEAPENCHPHWKDQLEELKISSNTLIGSLLNLISDHVQEHNRCGVYRGRDTILKKGRARFVRDRLLPKEVLSKNDKTKAGQMFKVVSIYDSWRRENWNEYLAGSSVHAASSLEGVEQEMWEKLYNSGIKIEEGKNERDSWDITNEILRVLGEDPEKHKEEAQKQKQKEQEGEGEGEERGDGEEGKEGAEGGDPSNVLGKLSKEAAKEIEAKIQHVHYTDAKDKEVQNTFPNTDIHISYGEMSNGGTYIPRDPTIIDTKEKVDSYRQRTEAWVEKINRIQGGKVLASQVKRLLISMKQQRWEHGHKRGHISGKNLWKARGPVYQDDVFKRRTSMIELDTAVTILTDNSGSMSGEKFAHAARAGLMLNEAMSKVGIPVELLSFSEDGRGPVNLIVKGFNEIGVHQDELTRRYAMCSSWMIQNSDGESIQWAANRLAKRKEKRRVLIVLSDGSPASGNHSGGYMGAYHYTKAVVEKIEDNSPLEIYGIGIKDENVSRIYKEYKVIHESSELENMLLDLVKQKVIRR